MKTLLSFILCSCLSVFCNAQLGNYDQDGEVKILSQRQSLTITNRATAIGTPHHAAGAVIGAILGPVIDIGIAVVKEKVKQNAAKYLSSFVVSASGSSFYVNSTNVNLPALTITRSVLLQSNSTETSAMTIVLEPELSPDKTAFRFVVQTPITYAYSSAKTKKEYDYLDINLDIKFKAILVTKSQYEVKDLRATSIKIPMLYVGNPTIPSGMVYRSGWMPFPSVPSMEIETSVAQKETKVVTVTGTKEGKSVNDNNSTETITTTEKAKDIERITTNSGLYEFEITVTESNPYKIKSENTQKLVEASGDATGSLLKTIVEQIFKKEEKKEDKK